MKKKPKMVNLFCIEMGDQLPPVQDGEKTFLTPALVNLSSLCLCLFQNNTKRKQAGAKLGKVSYQVGFGFTLIRIYRIIFINTK